MKKTILFFSVITTFLVFVACSNEDDLVIEQPEQSQPQTGKVTFFATGVICNEDESNAKVTRTQFAENSISNVIWSKTDKIYIDNKEYSLVSGNDETTGEFQGDAFAKKSATYKAYYYGQSEGTFPANQSYNNRQIVSYVPMSATVSVDRSGNVTKEVSFSNLCGLLRVTIKGPNTKKIKSITVSDDDKKMAGNYTLGTFLQIDQTNGTKSITLDCGVNGVALNPNGTDFYIAIPVACTKSGTSSQYSSFKIAITDDKEVTITKKLNNSSLNVTQSKITSITFSNLYTFKGGDVDVTGTTEDFDRTTLDDSAWSSIEDSNQ